MFQRFHAMKEKEEGGFTLIELLVVILIIAILAAIAIPVFLNQRKKGYAAQTESAVKNAATAEESYATDNNGAYTTEVASATTGLKNEGLRYNETNITLTVGVDNTAGTYCVKAVHNLDTAGSVRWYHSNEGTPRKTVGVAPCPA
jgi:type IV pilus assembly protein PilA